MKKPYEAARELAEGAIGKIPGRRSPGALALLGWFAAGAAAGAAAMYLLDPERGEARRMRIRERGAAWKNETARLAEEKARAWKAGARNLWSKFGNALPGARETLAENGAAEPEPYLH